jgi:nucleoside-diphosphate-sugar epimerase
MLTEQAGLHPVTPYGRSKVLVEEDLAIMADDGFSPVFLRNATAYGLSPRHRFDIVLNNLVAWAFTTGLVYLKSDGSPWRPLVHVQDICRAFVAALHADKEVVHNQAFNVGTNNENYRIREIAEIVRLTVPSCRIQYAPDAEPDRRTYRVDFNKVRAALRNFNPRWSAKEGAEELYLAYQTRGFTLEEFEGPKYKRVDHIQLLIREGGLDEKLRWRS